MPNTPLRRPALIIALFAGLISGLSALAQPAEITSLRDKAEKGNSIAQYNLGLSYATGREVSPDLPEAYLWLSLASANGTTGKALKTLKKQPPLPRHPPPPIPSQARNNSAPNWPLHGKKPRT